MLNNKILLEMQEYIEEHLSIMTLELCEAPLENKYSILEDVWEEELDNFIKNNHKPTLTQILFSHIEQKGVRDPDVYKKAGIDRKNFSKIRSNPNYRPKKNTIIALALALELNQKDTDDLLSSAGYTLSDSDTHDLIIQFCIKKKIYDIDQVNQALDYFSLKPLTG